jgi:hypothetical protein
MYCSLQMYMATKHATAGKQHTHSCGCSSCVCDSAGTAVQFWATCVCVLPEPERWGHLLNSCSSFSFDLPCIHVFIVEGMVQGVGCTFAVSTFQ